MSTMAKTLMSSTTFCPVEWLRKRKESTYVSDAVDRPYRKMSAASAPARLCAVPMKSFTSKA